MGKLAVQAQLPQQPGRRSEGLNPERRRVLDAMVKGGKLHSVPGGQLGKVDVCHLGAGIGFAIQTRDVCRNKPNVGACR